MKTFPPSITTKNSKTINNKKRTRTRKDISKTSTRTRSCAGTRKCYNTNDKDTVSNSVQARQRKRHVHKERGGRLRGTCVPHAIPQIGVRGTWAITLFLFPLSDRGDKEVITILAIRLFSFLAFMLKMIQVILSNQVILLLWC